MAQGIDPHIVFHHLKVEVGSGGVSGGASDADGLSLLDIGSHADLDAAHMGVQGGIAGAVGNHHIVAVRAGPLGDDDRARLGSVHRTGVTHPADVGALVVGGANAAGGITPAYGGGDIPAVHRPDVAAGVGVVFLSLRRHLFFQLLLHLLDLLLDAWAELMNQGKLENHRLIVAGEYYSGKERYAEQIARLGIGDKLVMMDCYIADREVAQLFSAVDLAVQPYRHATQSGVTQEAYWFDVPMVVTDVGGLREIVSDGEVGYVTEPDPKAIATAIDRFYCEEKSAEFRANILRFRERFTWQRMADNFIELFRKVSAGDR